MHGPAIATARITVTVVATILFCGCFQSVHGQVTAAPESEVESALDDFEVLTRGPIHEAFAAQTGQDPRPGIEVPRQPPEPINELPPDIKPEGDDVNWIPGYWQWDDDRGDFIWVSGVWRRFPLGQRWVPGYWDGVDGKYRWVSGFWASAEVDQLSYQPDPPESLEVGPSSIAPSDDHVWIPGCWEYQETQYAWRPGYWWEPRADLMYVPAHYAWTPNGCIYVAGYYDHAFDQRGVVFSPVYFRHGIYSRADFYYRPRIALSPTNLLLHLFFRPASCHFYFGDYYGLGYRQYRPWFEFRSVGRQYDPIYAYFQAQHRQTGIDYLSRSRGWHNYFVEYPDRRPPHTLAAQQQYETKHHNDSYFRQSLMAHRVGDSIDARRDNSRYVPNAGSDRDESTRRTSAFRELSSQRLREESASRGGRATGNRPSTLALPKERGREFANASPAKPQPQIDTWRERAGSGRARESSPRAANPPALQEDARRTQSPASTRARSLSEALNPRAFASERSRVPADADRSSSPTFGRRADSIRPTPAGNQRSRTPVPAAQATPQVAPTRLTPAFRSDRPASSLRPESGRSPSRSPAGPETRPSNPTSRFSPSSRASSAPAGIRGGTSQSRTQPSVRSRSPRPEFSPTQSRGNRRSGRD